MGKPMPVNAHHHPPMRTGVHTVEECDEVLARGPVPVVADAWLDERGSAMQAAADERLRRLEPPGAAA